MVEERIYFSINGMRICPYRFEEKRVVFTLANCFDDGEGVVLWISISKEKIRIFSYLNTDLTIENDEAYRQSDVGKAYSQLSKHSVVWNFYAYKNKEFFDNIRHFFNNKFNVSKDGENGLIKYDFLMENADEFMRGKVEKILMKMEEIGKSKDEIRRLGIYEWRSVKGIGKVQGDELLEGKYKGEKGKVPVA